VPPLITERGKVVGDITRKAEKSVIMRETVNWLVKVVVGLIRLSLRQKRSGLGESIRPDRMKSVKYGSNVEAANSTRSSAVTERCFVSLNISLSHSRLFEITSLNRACISPY